MEVVIHKMSPLSIRHNKNNMMSQYIYIYRHLLVAFVFLFTFIWFLSVHPLVVYDGDDWAYIGYVRCGLPLWKDWNPARVFPEVFMPLCGSIAAHIVYPICGDYLFSITLVSAFALSVFVTLYVYAFYMMLRRVFAMDGLTDALMSMLFFFMHFLLFRSGEHGNTYMLKCLDLTCEYYYIIPLLLNCSLVMFLLGKPNFGMDQKSAVGRGTLYFVLYLAVFSNLPASGILAVYSGSCVLVAFVYNVKHLKTFLEYLRKNGRVHIIILALWLISAVFELNGGRAENMGNNNQLHSLKSTLSALISMGQSINRGVLIVIGCVFALALVCALLKPDDVQEGVIAFAWQIKTLAVALFAMSIYVVFLCVAVSHEYAYRLDYIYGIVFFALILFFYAFSFLIMRKPRLAALLPVLVFVFAFSINTTGDTFQENNVSGIPYETCCIVSEDILNQVIQADRAGKETIDLRVPVHNMNDNWPHSASLETFFIETLIEHGIIKEWIDVTVCPDIQKNIEFGLPIPN